MPRCRRKLGSDCITSPPEKIVDTILGCLPLSDAVRTSVLSTHWRNRWKSVPKLVFDFRFNHPPMSNYKLDSIIYRVLSHHRGHITKFALQAFTSAAGPNIDSLLPLLHPAWLQDLSLHLYPCSKKALPHCFFTFTNLVHLNLYRCVFKLPPGFRGFPKLITLDFQDVNFSPIVFAHFISICRALERVRLVSCSSFDSFVVTGPRLKAFTFQGEFKSIHFKNSPALAEVSLAIHMDVVGETPVRQGFEYFHFVPTLQRLYLHPRVLEFMGAGADEYPESFISLQYIDLCMYLDNVNEIAAALRLLKNSPHLKKLHISLYACYDTEVGMESVLEFIRGLKTPDAELNHIRKVRIVFYGGIGQSSQIEFMRYLLAAAAKLEDL